ncbi:FlgO family outer membrane protein [Aliagarivorans marinus]|uniref:FlgO family outer membrane protein n=1 Tax=Aliagarivorans marinus TaxID=561965 RepID=UPI000478B26F|nr:FlgO family outer membrane protein [Aliagarivorans marinus]
MRYLKFLVVAVLLQGTLQGCSQNSETFHTANYTYVEPRESHDNKLYMYVDSLSKQLVDGVEIQAGETVAISSVADLNSLEASDVFGRQMSEAMFAALDQLGVRTVEARLTGRLLFESNQGEFSLSRDAEKLRDRMEITYLMVGSYQQSRSGRHVNLRLVHLGSQEVVSAAYEFVPNAIGITGPRVTNEKGSLERHDQSFL